MLHLEKGWGWVYTLVQGLYEVAPHIRPKALVLFRFKEWVFLILRIAGPTYTTRKDLCSFLCLASQYHLLADCLTWLVVSLWLEVRDLLSTCPQVRCLCMWYRCYEWIINLFLSSLAFFHLCITLMYWLYKSVVEIL